MDNLRLGDIVARKSYGGDVFFKVVDWIEQDGRKSACLLRGLTHRLVADADPDDLVQGNPAKAAALIHRETAAVMNYAFRDTSSVLLKLFSRLTSKPGRILHLDSSKSFMLRCVSYYSEAGVESVSRVMDEDKQPQAVSKLLKTYKPEVLVLTGHDGIKKGAENLNTPDSYRTSRYFIEAVKEARRYQSDPDKLFIFAGACQSYFEAIMAAGANFASSPGRILINGMDPAIVSRKISLTDKRKTVTPQEVIELTVTGAEGIGGMNSRGQMTVLA